MPQHKPDAKQAAQRAAELREALQRHDHLYFVQNAPEISDEAYDRLLRELADLEAAHPELITPDSPTQRVGERPLDSFADVTHAVPMLSVDNTYSPDELRDFDRRVRDRLGVADVEYVVDPKIDGVSAALRFEQGRLVRGATRGDGRTGDDITQNIRTIRSIPLKLHGDGWPAVLEIRGEVYWPRTDFARFNEQRLAAGESAFANPRNATAGTLKQLDSQLVAGRGLAFMAHGVGAVEPWPAELRCQTALFARLRDWGLPTSPALMKYATIDGLIAALELWQVELRTLDYDVDGLVIKVDRFDQREELGATSKAPRWCIAYKFAAEQAQTQLESVDFQVGKLGTITPRANLAPVQLAGTTVSHATLHNFDQVARLGLHARDTVTIEKAGEIIPQVVAVDATRRPPGAVPIEPPDTCPSCDTGLVRDEGGVYLRCMNPACPAQLVERLKHFAGRNQLDIDGLGEKLVEQLVDAGLVTRLADLYRLHERRDALLELPRQGAKSVDKLLAGIAASKQRSLARLLAALTIRHVGATTAEILADQFGSLAALLQADEDALQAVDGIGPEVAQSVVRWFSSAVGRRTIDELRAVGLDPRQEVTSAAAGPLSGKTLVVTGTLEHYDRQGIEALIKRLGGKSAGSVSKNTDYLVCGASPGSKLDKARRLGVEVLDEDAFRRLVGDA